MTETEKYKTTTKTETEKPKTVEVVLLSDYWDENCERIFKGEKLTLKTDTAIILIKEGKAERSLEDLQ